MRTFIGITRYSALALVSALAFATTASAQVSVNANLNASVQSNGVHAAADSDASADTDASHNLGARVNGEVMSQLHATSTAKAHADDNSALMATTSASSTVSADEGRPVKVAAKFLGLFPVHITGKAVVEADGTTKVKYPWYAFLFALGAAADTSVSAQ